VNRDFDSGTASTLHQMFLISNLSSFSCRLEQNKEPFAGLCKHLCGFFGSLRKRFCLKRSAEMFHVWVSDPGINVDLFLCQPSISHPTKTDHLCYSIFNAFHEEFIGDLVCSVQADVRRARARESSLKVFQASDDNSGLSVHLFGKPL
jgi:hypothetical protein